MIDLGKSKRPHCDRALGIIVKNYPQMALIQVSEILQFTQITIIICGSSYPLVIQHRKLPYIYIYEYYHIVLYTYLTG